jgi:hypothetical protein
MKVFEELVNLQETQDQLLREVLDQNMDGMHTTHARIHALSDQLANLRRKSKSGSKNLDLSDSTACLHRLNALWQELKAQDPYFDARTATGLFPPSIDFSQVDITVAEEMMDKISLIVTAEQNKIPEMMQKLKLATDLNEIISNIIKEMAKMQHRSAKTPVDNMR